jgi:DNA-binding LacI/PurR family transcriptional regulator
MGFDDLPIAGTMHPPLSSIRQPIEQMGRESANLILRQIADPGGLASRLILSGALIVRESTDEDAGPFD